MLLAVRPPFDGGIISHDGLNKAHRVLKGNADDDMMMRDDGDRYTQDAELLNIRGQNVSLG